jgi:hypothetical protein
MSITVSLQDSVAISKDVVSQELEGETVLLNLASGMYYGLNGVGTRVWQLLQDERSLQGIFDTLLEEYDVVAHQVEADLLGLLQDLHEQGIVRVTPKGEDAP